MSTTEPSATPLLYAVKRLELAIRTRLDEMLADSGVTTLQYTALTVLAVRDGVSAAQLARDSFVTPQSMGEMLRLLEERGLVRREPNPLSRRELLVHITDEGRALLTEHAEAAAAIEARMTAGLRAQDRADLRRWVARMWSQLA